MPRLSLRTPELEAEILRRMSEGEPLANICRDEHMPHMSTWREWCRSDEKLDIAHARARDDGFDRIAADTLRIADTPVEGVETTTDDKGTSEKRGDMLGHRKLQIETRLKLLAKWDPRRYGDKVQTELTGKDGGPIQTEDLTPADAARRIAFALALGLKHLGGDGK